MVQQFNQTELVNYQSKYSESKFWSKIKTIIKNAGKDLLYLALLLYYVLQSDDVSLRYKATIIGALGYLILPLDFIPDTIPVIGFTDDLTALTTAYEIVKSSITPEIEARAKAKADELL
jgi:uncharacterized membrane protein YkvA (DUF1232 family)